jgi:hypothetical protein
MNGAESLLKSLVASDVKVCFGNPGRSEMHFVAALDECSDDRSALRSCHCGSTWFNVRSGSISDI